MKDSSSLAAGLTGPMEHSLHAARVAAVEAELEQEQEPAPILRRAAVVHHVLV